MTDEALPPVAVRPYRPLDLDSVVDLWYESWQAALPDLTHHEPKAVWRQRFIAEIAPVEQVFVAEVSGQLAGFLALRDDGNGQGYLHQIFVAPEFQHQGVGSTLVALAKQLAPAGLRLHTLERNSQAASVYERHGFSVVSTGIGRVGLPNAQYAWEPTSGGWRVR